MNAGSVNVFKISLDRLWATQDILYNYRGVIEKKIYVIYLSIRLATGTQVFNTSLNKFMISP